MLYLRCGSERTVGLRGGWDRRIAPQKRNVRKIFQRNGDLPVAAVAVNALEELQALASSCTLVDRDADSARLLSVLAHIGTCLGESWQTRPVGK
jgi:hypothetical protein